MAAVYDWDDPFTLTTPVGTLLINQLEPTTLGYFMLDHEACSSGHPLRAPRDNVPQQPGDILHNHFRQGYEMSLLMELYGTSMGADCRENPTCDTQLTAMGDLLQQHLNSIIGEDPFLPINGRIQWTPQGPPVDRMLDRCRLLVEPIFLDDGAITTVSFTLVTQYPYAMDAPNTTTSFAASTTIFQTGTCPGFPVIRVHGPFNTFQLRNNSYLDENGQPVSIVYDAGRVGAQSVGSGHYVEIDCWANTAYLDGNGADLMPCIDITASDFFSLQTGPNMLDIIGGYTGTGVDVIWQNYYS